jgi:hypothetical protein
MLEAAVQRSNGRFTLMDILSDIVDGEQSLWVAMKDKEIIGCCTVRIVRYPTDLVTLSYEYLGGENVSVWIDEGHRVLSEYAREYGATRLEVPQGRRGWEPLLKKLGYKLFSYKFECNLED